MNLQRQTFFSVSIVGVPIRNTADYSPFGVQLDGRTVQGDFYRRGYQGSEKDDETKGGGNSYTTEFRMLDPRVGKWLSLDPMMNKFPWQSPYCTMDNNPICLNDRTGLSTKDDDWHPEDDGQGSQKLVADPGDNMETLKIYLNNVGVPHTDIDLKQWENEFVQTGKNGAAELTSTSGQFENLMGTYLMKMMNQDIDWGFVDCGVNNSCSPTSANRMKLAALAVFGPESREFDGLNLTLNENCLLEKGSYTPRGRVGYNGIQNSFCNGVVDHGKYGITDGNKNYIDPKFNAIGLGFTQEMRNKASCGGLEFAGVMSSYITGEKLWTNLKHGALIGLESHSGIFVKYEYKGKEVVGMFIWDQESTLQFVSKNDTENGARRGGNLK